MANSPFEVPNEMRDFAERSVAASPETAQTFFAPDAASSPILCFVVSILAVNVSAASKSSVLVR